MNIIVIGPIGAAESSYKLRSSSPGAPCCQASKPQCLLHTRGVFDSMPNMSAYVCKGVLHSELESSYI
jgi:hypothetical protein